MFEGIVSLIALVFSGYVFIEQRKDQEQLRIEQEKITALQKQQAADSKKYNEMKLQHSKQISDIESQRFASEREEKLQQAAAAVTAQWATVTKNGKQIWGLVVEVRAPQASEIVIEATTKKQEKWPAKCGTLGQGKYFVESLPLTEEDNKKKYEVKKSRWDFPKQIQGGINVSPISNSLSHKVEKITYVLTGGRRYEKDGTGSVREVTN